jgi:hypothetical protein
MIKKYLSLSILALAVLLSVTSRASADPIVIHLGGISALADDPIVIPGTIGTTVDFPVELDNTDNNVALFLNGSSFNIDSPLVIDDLLFTNFPASIAAGAVADGILFTVDLPTGLAPGLYNGTYSIFGGFTPNDFDDLADISFQIDAQPAASPVPEPGTWLLFATGLSILGAAVYMRGRREASFERAV